MLYLPKSVHVWFVPREDVALHTLLLGDDLDGTALIDVPRGLDGKAPLPPIGLTEPVFLASSTAAIDASPDEWAESTIRFRLAATGASGANRSYWLREESRTEEMLAAELGELADVLRQAGERREVLPLPVPPWVRFVR
ncbi:hypothetical protein ACWGH2_41840 [Streptomyces sp. NPDC054871]